MWDDIHALGLVGVIVIAVVFLIRDFGFQPRMGYVLGVAIIASVGAVSALLLNARGMPLREWLLPLVIFVLTGPFLKSEHMFRAFRIAMFAAAAVLSVSFLLLISDSYATHLDGATAAHNRVILREAATKVGELKGVLPHAPVENIIGPVGSPVVLAEKGEWHTWFTGLRQREKATVWSPGGDPTYVSHNLQVRANQ
jgi:hypothetical protein